MHRRTFIAGSAAVAIAGGCTGVATDERDGVMLTHVELGNGTGEPQVFDVLVTRDDEIIHWSSHEVEGGTGDRAAGGTVVEIDAPDEPGRVDVYVRVGEVWQRTDFDADEYDGERVIAVVTYGTVDDDMLRISRRRSDRGAGDDG